MFPKLLYNGGLSTTEKLTYTITWEGDVTEKTESILKGILESYKFKIEDTPEPSQEEEETPVISREVKDITLDIPTLRFILALTDYKAKIFITDALSISKPIELNIYVTDNQLTLDCGDRQYVLESDISTLI